MYQIIFSIFQTKARKPKSGAFSSRSCSVCKMPSTASSGTMVKTALFNKTVNPSLLSLFKTWKKRLEYISTHNGDYYPSLLTTIQAQQEDSSQPFSSLSNSNTLHRLEETRGMVGLENEDDQFCYLNAVIQCLLATVPLMSFFYPLDYNLQIMKPD